MPTIDEEFFNRERATTDRWKTQPLSTKRQRLDVRRDYHAMHWDSISRGLIPRAMEDKWFIYADGLWLHFHRSWTGFCIFSARFEVEEDRLTLVEAWVCRDPEQFTGFPYLSQKDGYDDAAERESLYGLVDGLLGSENSF